MHDEGASHCFLSFSSVDGATRHLPELFFNQYKDTPNVVFLVDPPYLSTEVSTYKMYWKLADYLDVLSVLAGHSFVYFTSNKSSILELCDWIGRNKHIGNPLEKCTKVEFNARMNYNSTYTDMMLYKNAG